MPIEDADVLLLVAAALGKNPKDAAEWAGLTTRKANSRLAANRDFFDRLTAPIRGEIDRIRSAECEKVRALSEKEYKAENEKMLGLVHAVRRRILEAGVTGIDIDSLALAANVATDVEQRQLGKPKQINEVKFQGAICVWNPQPVLQLKRDELELLDAHELVTKYLPGEVLDAQVVEDSSS